MNRRGFILTSATIGGVTLMVSREAAAQADDLKSKYLTFAGPEHDPEFGAQNGGAPVSGDSPVGPQNSAHQDIPVAFRFLFNAPGTQGYMPVARYFEKITDTGSTGEPFNAEWNRRANPLITGLFSATQTAPSLGDQTHWCAAFVNFCLQVSGKKATYSALSGSFRKYGSPRDGLGQLGDIAVFSKSGPDGAKGFGHVGFVVSENDTSVVVLGGNQRGVGNTGQVKESTFAKVDGGGLKYLGARIVA